MAEDIKKIKIPRFLPPLAKLFQKKIQKFFGISVCGEGEVKSSTFAWFKRDKYAYNIVAASADRYISKFHKPFFQYSLLLCKIMFWNRVLRVYLDFSTVNTLSRFSNVSCLHYCSFFVYSLVGFNFGVL